MIALLFSSALALATPPSGAEGIVLTQTDVDVQIVGPTAELTIRQVFENHRTEFLEATYVFPLHEQSAVDDMAMRIGDREIRGRIKTREAARKAYEKAKEKGQAAALTEQERGNVFTQSVANIPPGEAIEVVLHLVQPLTYEDGVYSFHHPLVVGPRFVPAGVADGDRVTPPMLPGPGSLGGGQDTGHRVNFELSADLDLPLARVEIGTHPEALLTVIDGVAEISLEGIRATRDIVVEFEPDVDEPAVSFLAADGHFSLLLEPPTLPDDHTVVPRELIFVVDNSCSMSGTPMDMAKEAMRTALNGLLPADSFQVLRFSETASALAPRPLPATPRNVALGLGYVEGMRGMGGTMMIEGIKAALGFPEDPSRQRIVCFMTDGYIGNENEIFAAINDMLGGARLFAFGIGSSVNRHLLDGMAREGRGHHTVVLLHEDPAGKVDAFYERIARPVLTDVRLSFGDMDVDEIYPAKLPDLFAGQPLRVTGTYEGELGSVTLVGRQGHRDLVTRVEAEEVEDGDTLRTSFARAKVAELEQQQIWGEIEEAKAEIVQTALEYRLLTRYTSFVAVERKVRNRGGAALSLDIPVDTPDGVSFDAIVGTELSRRHVRPGDPLITVGAPEGAQSVTAFFPWGEVAAMRWDGRRSRWYHRFLVPRGIADGWHKIRVLIRHDDGSMELQVEEIEVDSEAPEFEVEADSFGGAVRVRVWLDEPLRGLQIYPAGHPELRHRIDLRQADPGEEAVEVWVPGDWDEIVVVAKDLALNRMRVKIEVAR
jgi:Ca-activated chloride channel family protein